MKKRVVWQQYDKDLPAKALAIAAAKKDKQTAGPATVFATDPAKT